MKVYLVVLCSIGLFLEYVIVEKRFAKADAKIVQLTQELEHTRRAASSCHRLVAEHWSTNHQIVPGSKEIAQVASDLASNLERR